MSTDCYHIVLYTVYV